MTKPARRGRPPGHGSRYRTIAADLARRLSSNEWPVGTPMPAYPLLARSYGVGTKLIRLALKALAADGHVVIRQGRPTLAALGAPLSAVLKNVVVLVLDKSMKRVFAGQYGRAIRDGIDLGLHEVKCPPLLVLHQGDRWRVEFPAGLSQMPLKGVLLLGPFRAELLRQYENLGAPVVLLDQPGDKYKFHSVAADNCDAAFNATSRLIELGHKRIVFIRSVRTSIRDICPDARERQQGFEDACKQAGFEQSQFRIVTVLSKPSFQALVRSKPPFTAFLTSDDTQACWVAAAAESAGLSIPRDLSIAAFHGSPPVSRNWAGPQIDFLALGRKAVALLHSKSDAPMHVRLQTTWNDGDSLSPFRERRP